METFKYDIFLSHATLDKPVVEELARRLVELGFKPWLDKWNLIPGEPWQEAIEQALEDCAACAVCLGPSGTGPWQNEEMRAAIARRVADRSRTFRVIPVLLPQSERGEPSRLPAFLRATIWIEFRESLDDEKALHRLVCGIRGLPPGADPGEAVAEGACPYRGLQVFDVGDALFFFGREALTEWLLDKLRTDRSANRFLAIVGPSGSGKSSLARAGLLAALKQGEIPGSDAWPAAICKPGEQPLESLAVALAGAARLGDSPSAVRDLIRDLGADPRMLHLTTRLSLRDAPADRRLVVLVDQFEEVFTLCSDETQRKALIANLLHAATAADGQTVVVLTLRADFYGRCAAYPDLATAISDRQSLVGPMTRDELCDAIERPAYLAGCELEGGLTDLLLNEVESQPGSLPLLEHALLQIWQRREGGRRLTIEAYREVGGVAGALEKHAEEVYSGFTEEGKEICRRVFLRLVQVDEQGRATKRRLGLEELPDETVVSRLTNARLLTTDQEKHPTVELAHEALLANWGRLKQWIEQDRKALSDRRHLDEAAAEWISKNREPSFLLVGGRLAEAEDWAKGHPEEKTPKRREFLAASIAAGDRERRRQRKWTLISLTAAAMALIAAVSAVYLWRVSDQRKNIDLAGRWAAKSKALLKDDPILGLLFSIKAMRLSGNGGQPHLPSAEEALRSALAKSRGVPLRTGKIRAASLSADGRRLALAGTDDVVSIWDLEPAGGPTKITTLPSGSLSHSVRQLAVSSGGRWVVIADQLGDSHLFRLEGVSSLNGGSFTGEDWLAGNDPFSPDGRWLLTRGKSSAWRIRNLTQPGQPSTLRMNPKAVAFSSDGRWLASAETGSIHIWDLKSLGSNPSIVYPFQNVAIVALAFSSDSQWLVADEDSAQGGIAQAWSPNDLTTAFYHCRWVSNGPNRWDSYLASRIRMIANCLALGPGPLGFEENEITAMAQRDRTTVVGLVDGQLWMNNQARFPLTDKRAQKGPVKLLAFQGQRLIAQSGDEAPRLLDERFGGLEPAVFNSPLVLKAFSSDGLKLWWNEEKRTLWLEGVRGSWPLTYVDGEIDHWLFSPDSRWLATVKGDERTPIVWHLDANGKPSPPVSLSGPHSHSVKVTALTFSLDGRWLASGDAAGESRLWNLSTPESEPMALVNHRGKVEALAFNRTGSVVATAGEDGMVRISNIAEGQAPRMSANSPTNRGEPVISLAYLSEDRLVITSSSRTILWKLGHEVPLMSPDSNIVQLLSSPGGTHLAGLTGQNIVVWYPKDNGDLLPAPVVITSYDTGSPIGFTADGNKLETYDKHNGLKVWELRIDSLLKIACRAAGRNLTEREWRENISEPYQEREPCPEFPKAYD